jgi:predicted signal transduction protein with EAL and GGDEF domain
MVELGQTLGLSTIAEGIETCAQLDGLRSVRCPYGQGFIFARPQSPEAIEPLLARNEAAEELRLSLGSGTARVGATIDAERGLAGAFVSDA